MVPSLALKSKLREKTAEVGEQEIEKGISISIQKISEKGDTFPRNVGLSVNYNTDYCALHSHRSETLKSKIYHIAFVCYASSLRPDSRAGEDIADVSNPSTPRRKAGSTLPVKVHGAPSKPETVCASTAALLQADSDS